MTSSIKLTCKSSSFVSPTKLPQLFYVKLPEVSQQIDNGGIDRTVSGLGIHPAMSMMILESQTKIKCLLQQPHALCPSVFDLDSETPYPSNQSSSFCALPSIHHHTHQHQHIPPSQTQKNGPPGPIRNTRLHNLDTLPTPKTHRRPRKPVAPKPHRSHP